MSSLTITTDFSDMIADVESAYETSVSGVHGTVFINHEGEWLTALEMGCGSAYLVGLASESLFNPDPA